MRQHEDREVMYHMLRPKENKELTLRVYLTRRLVHRMFSERIRKRYPLTGKIQDAKGKERLINLSTREELWNVSLSE